MEYVSHNDALVGETVDDSGGSGAFEKPPPENENHNTTTSLREDDEKRKASQLPPLKEHAPSEPSPKAELPEKAEIFPSLDQFMVFAPIRAPGETMSAYHKKKFVCEVEKVSMRDWRKSSWHNLRWPMPILQAFYVQKPGNAENVSREITASIKPGPGREAPTEEIEVLRNLQRIIIHSEVLYEELILITSISSVVFPIISFSTFYRTSKLGSRNYKRSWNTLSSGSTLDTTSNDSPKPSKGEEDLSSVPAEQGPMGVGQSGEVHRKDSRVAEESVSMSSDADQRDSTQTQLLQLKCLYDFIARELKEEIELRERAKMGTLLKIRFQDLWHLYQMGDLVYSHSHGRDQLYKVYAVTGGQVVKCRIDTKESFSAAQINIVDYEEAVEFHEEKLQKEEYSGVGIWTTFKVDCYKMAFDGVHCGPVDVLKRIRPYTGEREVTSLPIFPIQFHAGRDLLTRKLEDRGRKLLFGEAHQSYDGGSVALDLGDKNEKIESDVYIDFETYFQDFPLKKPQFGRFYRSKQNPAEVEEEWPGIRLLLSGHEVDMKRFEEFMAANRTSLEPFKPEKNNISEKHLVLLPPWVFGHIFQTRRWSRLDIELVTEIDRESDTARRAGFDDLIIDQRNRDLLVALVDNHASGLQREMEKTKRSHTLPKPTQIDLVRGKGQGLIILLHGPPGSGKTSTAETIAAYTGRPLYAITCGDIGTTPLEVEYNMYQHTTRADRWGCILLLDEADVFLVQRDWRDVHRNALVSVFLRQLEYYSGILFLTTNRPGVLDEAFKSRIHISIRYPSIDLESTKAMWRNIMNRLEEDNKSAPVKIVFDRDALLEFAQRHFEKCQQAGVAWNGRQIRNAFQTAIALGHYERVAKIRAEKMTLEEALATGKKKWKSVKLTKANFQKIARTSSEFEEYIENLRGNDSMKAREMELRDDDYDPQASRARKHYLGSTGLRDTVWTGYGKDRGRSSKMKQPVREEPSSEEEEDDASEDLSPESNDED